MHITFWITAYSVMKLFSFYSAFVERFIPCVNLFPKVPSPDLFLSVKEFPLGSIIHLYTTVSQIYNHLIFDLSFVFQTYWTFPY